MNPTQAHICIDTTHGPLCAKSCSASASSGWLEKEQQILGQLHGTRKGPVPRENPMGSGTSGSLLRTPTPQPPLSSQAPGVSSPLLRPTP